MRKRSSLSLSPPFFSGTEKALEEGEAQLKRDSIHQEAKFASWDAHNYVDLLKVQTGESKLASWRILICQKYPTEIKDSFQLSGGKEAGEKEVRSRESDYK